MYIYECVCVCVARLWGDGHKIAAGRNTNPGSWIVFLGIHTCACAYLTRVFFVCL